MPPNHYYMRAQCHAIDSTSSHSCCINKTKFRHNCVLSSPQAASQCGLLYNVNDFPPVKEHQVLKQAYLCVPTLNKRAQNSYLLGEIYMMLIYTRAPILGLPNSFPPFTFLALWLSHLLGEVQLQILLSINICSHPKLNVICKIRNMLSCNTNWHTHYCRRTLIKIWRSSSWFGGIIY